MKRMSFSSAGSLSDRSVYLNRVLVHTLYIGCEYGKYGNEVRT
jgi:hypothetical protein